MYKDCLISSTEDINELGWDSLGDPRIDSERYIWGKVKLPAGRTWKKDAEHFKDKEYVFSQISFYDKAPDLYVKFTPSKGYNSFYAYSEESKHVVWYMFKQRVLYLTIKRYAELTGFQVMNDLGGIGVLGRHFEEGILSFWQTHKLAIY